MRTVEKINSISKRAVRPRCQIKYITSIKNPNEKQPINPTTPPKMLEGKKKKKQQTSPVLQERAFQLSSWISSKRNEIIHNKLPFSLQIVLQYHWQDSHDEVLI